MMEQVQVDKILRARDAADMLAVSISTFYRMAKSVDQFPKVIDLGGGRKGYLMSEIQAYIRYLADKRDQVA